MAGLVNQFSTNCRKTEDWLEMSFIQFNFSRIEEFDFYVKKLLIINPIGCQKNKQKNKVVGANSSSPVSSVAFENEQETATSTTGVESAPEVTQQVMFFFLFLCNVHFSSTQHNLKSELCLLLQNIL